MLVYVMLSLYFYLLYFLSYNKSTTMALNRSPETTV